MTTPADTSVMQLELVPVPVGDVDRARVFYEEQLGFHVDHDVRPAEGVRVVQLTPRGSACSIVLSTGLPGLGGMTVGSLRGLHLVVANVERTRAELLARGVDVGEIDDAGRGVRYAAFRDPDGNSWVLQELAWRSPGP
ncbi:VOC family protein [Deinococcus pimensis]|uniref:VOC family protein n=1 Tax=Deinococcus pimensis TaxID=309888 RepID=UPI00048789DC|nr:VOC family protein [Deinococcus pimensis]